MKTKLAAVGLASLLSAQAALAESVNSAMPQEYVQSGRYTNVVNAPDVAQRNPLKVVVNTRLPDSISTVEDAVQFLLARSGYELADARVMTHESRILMQLEVPQVQRTIRSMSLDQALTMLGGEAMELVVDPINRKVAYVADRDLIGG